MNRKLVIITIVLFSVALGVYLIDPLGNIRRNPARFDEFPVGDVYGSIKTSDLRYILAELDKDSILPYGKAQLKLLPNLINSLEDNGFDVSVVYLVGDLPQQTIHFMIPYSNQVKAYQYLEESAYLFDFGVDSIAGNIVYDFEGMQILRGKHWVRLSYTDTLLFAGVSHIENRRAKLNTDVLERPNTFYTSGKFTDSLGIAGLTLELDAKKLRMNGTIELTDDKLPAPMKTSMSIPTLGETESHFRIQMHQLRNQHASPIDMLFRKFSDYGLKEKELREVLNGQFSYEKGPDMEVIDTIVTIQFDEDFNPLEERRVRRKMQPTFLIFIGSAQPKKLESALRKNNFLRPSGNIVRLPDGRLARYTVLENGLLYSSLQIPEANIEIKSVEQGARFPAYGTRNWVLKWTTEKLEVSFVLELSRD
jgi:hypothetical protein